MRLGPVERLEQCLDVAFVGFLRGGEAGLVYTIVDLVIMPCVCLVNLRLEIRWIEDKVTVFLVQMVVKL